jgi:two-component system alkaline phosphatase synthesis response regulator PhoP
VWGYDYAGGSNVIEANVRSLRRKLGDRATSIETVRGLGYRFHVLRVAKEADARV